MPANVQPRALELNDLDVAPSGATVVLADFVARTTLADIPTEAQALLRGCFLDFVGNSAFASAHAESSLAIRTAIRQLDGKDGPATVIGEASGYSWQMAALLNGAYAHSLDFDDTNQIQTGHPGVPVIAAALAEAELMSATLASFLEALAVGYEVCCRVGGAIGQAVMTAGFSSRASAAFSGPSPQSQSSARWIESRSQTPSGLR